MHIQELILDGFKSYPVRTQITGWDPSFNAITGLNGSGKSNILDAICFVLGLTNMASMRAQNQQDLIYKRGQAGVTKASVTIVFDNTDRATSPLGYECAQVTVTRQIAIPNLSKYLVNGHKATQQQVQTLFQSVQLNINNPNFLIMQGRITKVLNMRPQDILGMVEEAAGTRMFEERKEKSLKIIARKNMKVEELQADFDEEITPKLAKLREEKRSYVQWQRTCTELERIGRTLRAHEYTEARQRAIAKQREIEAAEREVTALKNDKGRFDKEIKAAEKEINEVNKQREKELKKDGKFKKLEEEVSEHGKNLAKVRTQVELKIGVVKDEEGKIAVSERELEELRASSEDKLQQVKKLTLTHATVKEKQDALEATLNNTDSLLQSLVTGLSSSNNGATGGGYMGQISEAEERKAHAGAEEQQAKVQLGMKEKELGELEGRYKKVEREAKDSAQNLDSMRATVESFKKKISETGWSDEKEQKHENDLREAKNHVRRFAEARDAVRSRVAGLDFEYESPHPNFDRNKVKGLVASLVKLDQVNYNASTALEITAGGRLYNVVVESDEVGKQLLSQGRLRKRVTLIPLNRIESFRVSPQKIQAAERMSGGKARLAISLIGHPNEVANAMFYVFGGTFICEDAQTAKQITFSREVGVKSVTLDGDVYDPSGTLSGGAAPSSSGVLIKVQQLIEAEGNLQEARRKLEALEREEVRWRDSREKWKALSRELNMKEHELKLLQEQVNGSNASRIGAEVEAARNEIATLKERIQVAAKKKQDAITDIKKLEKDMNEFKNNKEGKIDELKVDLKKQRVALREHTVLVKTHQKELQTATLESEQIEQDILRAEKDIDSARAGLKKLQKELEKLEAELEKVEALSAQAEKNLAEERATLSRYDEELKSLDRVIREKKQAISDTDLKITQREHEVTHISKEKTAAENMVANLEKQYDWIVQERDQFGKAGTPYDFRKVDIGQLRTKAQELEATQKGMKKKINPKSAHMLEDIEKKETEVTQNLRKIHDDKQRILETLETLDRHKREAVEKTWAKVNDDFGAIFAELLPGNFAKLQPPDGQDLMQGLEVKVRLGTVWKQSLTELSGGQRSLIALSLIMSLLQFKPAPMYILDEIDAALDLSHTQHIGQLFRTRFKGSQFIVVSLKEGLFTNANVLFRTRFRDGTSIVERTASRSGAGSGGAGAAHAHAVDDDENVPPGGRRARR